MALVEVLGGILVGTSCRTFKILEVNVSVQQVPSYQGG